VTDIAAGAVLDLETDIAAGAALDLVIDIAAEVEAAAETVAVAVAVDRAATIVEGDNINRTSHLILAQRISSYPKP